MAHLHNYRHRQQPSMISQIGQKVLHAAQFAAEAKGLWDLGMGYIPHSTGNRSIHRSSSSSTSNININNK
jgi:hypothetical protein